MDITSLFRRIMYAEWAAIVVSAIFQVTWGLSSATFDNQQLFSLICLAVLFVLSILRVDRMSANQRVWLMAFDIIIVTIAMLNGAHRMYGLLFLVIAGKISIALEKKALVCMGVFFVCVHTAAFLYLRHHHVAAQAVAILDQHVSKVVLIESQMFFIGTMTIALLFGRVLVSELKSRSAAEKLAREIETMAVSVERSRMARDMHDSIGHSLTSLNIQLELTQKLLATGDKEQAEKSLSIAREAAKNSLEDVRKTVRAIREEDFSLEQSVQEITCKIGKQQNINFDVKIDENELSPPCRHNLLMILQECLTNIQKHSEASSVTIELVARLKEAHLTVTDNGKGFQLDRLGNGCGIKGLMDRVCALGGAVDIKTKPGSGTAVFVKLPT